MTQSSESIINFDFVTDINFVEELLLDRRKNFLSINFEVKSIGFRVGLGDHDFSNQNDRGMSRNDLFDLNHRNRRPCGSDIHRVDEDESQQSEYPD